MPLGFNPVAAMIDRPRLTHREPRWFEVPDAALLLHAARVVSPPPNSPAACPAGFARALLATFLYTGGRRGEVLGLEVEDVSFDRQTITFRENAWRGLKTPTSARPVPLWPELEAILRAYVFGTDRPPSRLLFPSYRTGREAMLRDERKILDRIAMRAGYPKGELRTRRLRHTYCAARLQTLDQGAPVSIYTVAHELGHASLDMVERVYAHLGAVRHRSDVVEYCVAQHLPRLRDRLTKLGLGLPRSCESRGGGVTLWARRDSNPRPLAPEPGREEKPPRADEENQ